MQCTTWISVDLPPCRVSVENGYSVSVAPASLWAATNRVYHVACASEHRVTGCWVVELDEASKALQMKHQWNSKKKAKVNEKKKRMLSLFVSSNMQASRNILLFAKHPRTIPLVKANKIACLFLLIPSNAIIYSSYANCSVWLLLPSLRWSL